MNKYKVPVNEPYLFGNEKKYLLKCLNDELLWLWRGGRAVEGARLESVYTVKGIVGSNPTLSAIFKISPIYTSQQKSNIIEIWNEENHWQRRNMKSVMRKHSHTLLKF